MSSDLDRLIRHLESAQAQQNDGFNRASGGRSRPIGGGFAHWRGEGHPLNQALGLIDPVTDGELGAIEAFLGAPTVLELSPGADPGLWPLLARRGYRLGQFQQLLTRDLVDVPPPDPSAEVRPAGPGEAELQVRVVGAGFGDTDAWQAFEPPFSLPDGVPGCQRYLALVQGEPAGGATLGWIGDVALLSGDAVLPRFRGAGLQKALILARLQEAARLGCRMACASTLPSTPSQRAYEACGFRVAYPKVEMVKD